MRRRSRTLSLTLAVTAAAVLSVAAPDAASADNPYAKPLTLAVIGDVPYGTDQEAGFGDLIGAVNSDPKVRVAVHVGDFKSGSTTCSNERFTAVRTAFDSFEDPLILTPGDNDWTDCHRVNNGGYEPLERLAALRSTFFATPGTTLGGRSLRVRNQPSLVENVRWTGSGVVFATLHVVGSNNGLAPQSGLGRTAPTPEQVAEVDARVVATPEWVDKAFDAAERSDALGVVLAMQADTWQPLPESGQQAVVDRITARTAAFDGQVLVLQGDSHEFVADNPLGLANFTRIVVHGETLPFEYLRLTVDRRDPELFSWTRVQVPQA